MSDETVKAPGDAGAEYQLRVAQLRADMARYRAENPSEFEAAQLEAAAALSRAQQALFAAAAEAVNKALSDQEPPLVEDEDGAPLPPERQPRGGYRIEERTELTKAEVDRFRAAEDAGRVPPKTIREAIDQAWDRARDRAQELNEKLFLEKARDEFVKQAADAASERAWDSVAEQQAAALNRQGGEVERMLREGNPTLRERMLAMWSGRRDGMSLAPQWVKDAIGAEIAAGNVDVGRPLSVSDLDAVDGRPIEILTNDGIELQPRTDRRLLAREFMRAWEALTRQPLTAKECDDDTVLFFAEGFGPVDEIPLVLRWDALERCGASRVRDGDFQTHRASMLALARRRRWSLVDSLIKTKQILCPTFAIDPQRLKTSGATLGDVDLSVWRYIYNERGTIIADNYRETTHEQGNALGLRVEFETSPSLESRWPNIGTPAYFVLAELLPPLREVVEAKVDVPPPGWPAMIDDPDPTRVIEVKTRPRDFLSFGQPFSPIQRGDAIQFSPSRARVPVSREIEAVCSGLVEVLNEVFDGLDVACVPEASENAVVVSWLLTVDDERQAGFDRFRGSMRVPFERIMASASSYQGFRDIGDDIIKVIRRGGEVTEQNIARERERVLQQVIVALRDMTLSDLRTVVEATPLLSGVRAQMRERVGTGSRAYFEQ